MGFEQHAALDIATASSTRSAGNLVGSPAFNVSRRRVVALDIGWLWRSDRNFQPLACLLPEVFKQRSCHEPNFDMDRKFSFLGAPLLVRGFFVCDQYYIVMQLDHVYVHRLVVLVVRTLNAPLPAR